MLARAVAPERLASTAAGGRLAQPPAAVGGSRGRPDDAARGPSGARHTRTAHASTADGLTAALARVVRARGERAGARDGPTARHALLQRKLHVHTGRETDPLHAIGLHVQAAVDAAVATIAADPMLSDYSKTDTSGYIRTWINTYAKFLGDPTVIPVFFYARYGYAVETIATKLLRSLDIRPYTFGFQVAHGHTRPDVVVLDRGSEVAWLDLTSEASKGHIRRKQGGGWWMRSYVAEACYEMPRPSALALGADALDDDTRQRLAAASQFAAAQAVDFEVGRVEFGAEISENLQWAFESSGPLTKAYAREVILWVARGQLGDDMTGPLSKSVVAMLDNIEVNGQSTSGQSWANWAFDGRITSAPARDRLMAYGRKLSAAEKPAYRTPRPTRGGGARKPRGTRTRDATTIPLRGRVAKPRHKQKERLREKSARKRNQRIVRSGRRGS